MKRTLSTSILVLSCIAFGFGQADADYKATLKKMFEVSGSQETFKTAVTQMSAMFKQNSQIPDDVWTDMEKEFLLTSMEQLAEMLTPVYEKHLTKADLQQVIKFYETPAGVRFAAKTPLIMEESMKIGQEWGMKIGQQLQQKIKEKGY